MPPVVQAAVAGGGLGEAAARGMKYDAAFDLAATGILASLAGGLALFVWGVVTWTLFPIGSGVFRAACSRRRNPIGGP